MEDDILLLKYFVARFFVGIGEWFVSTGIDVAGDGGADVWFEASFDRPLPWWLKALGYSFGLALFWMVILVLFSIPE